MYYVEKTLSNTFTQGNMEVKTFRAEQKKTKIKSRIKTK